MLCSFGCFDWWSEWFLFALIPREKRKTELVREERSRQKEQKKREEEEHEEEKKYKEEESRYPPIISLISRQLSFCRNVSAGERRSFSHGGGGGFADVF